ncbi:hypothetical protein [Arcobacter sp. LA11]|uniref:hypothetical protein n=1 Tax=Arcobacter sp. LA11 TaxID=1898176 RepID=UPI000934CF57|nr:hypothetical protein [Arcobacter sp. LA11]
MKKAILLLILTLTQLFSYNTNVKAAYAIGIFDESGNGENVQHVRKTKHDYNNTCYTKVFVVGTFFKLKPDVYIGNSKGHFQSSKSIYNKRKIKIGEVLTYKHHAVTKGYFKVLFRNKLYDTKVFVK